MVAPASRSLSPPLSSLPTSPGPTTWSTRNASGGYNMEWRQSTRKRRIRPSLSATGHKVWTGWGGPARGGGEIPRLPLPPPAPSPFLAPLISQVRVWAPATTPPGRTRTGRGRDSNISAFPPPSCSQGTLIGDPISTGSRRRRRECRGGRWSSGGCLEEQRRRDTITPRRG